MTKTAHLTLQCIPIIIHVLVNDMHKECMGLYMKIVLNIFGEAQTVLQLSCTSLWKITMCIPAGNIHKSMCS